MTDKTAAVLAEIAAERDRQDARFGEQNHPNGTGGAQARKMRDEAQKTCDAATERGTLTWLHISDEEHCEALAESDPVRLRAELVQDAAVKVAWIEALDRAALPDGDAARDVTADDQPWQWSGDIAAHGTGDTFTIDIDARHPNGGDIIIEIPLGDARRLHTMLGDRIAEGAAASLVAPGSLRDRIDHAIRPVMALGLQDAELDGPGGTQRINEWADWTTETVMTVRDTELYHMTLRTEGVEESVKTLTLALLKAGQRLNQVEADRDRRIEQLVGELDSRMAAQRRMAAERDKRAEKAEAERDKWVAFIERGFDTHMQFGILNEDGTTEQMPCADWCYACKIEELNRLKSCQDPHCVEGRHAIDLGPAEETPEPQRRGCPDWHHAYDHDAHEWTSSVDGLVKCPGWDSEGFDGDSDSS